MSGEPENLLGLDGPTFTESLARCRFRSVCTPRGVASEGHDQVTVHAAITLLGRPVRLTPELVERLAADISAGKAFMICTEYADTLQAALRLVDEIAAVAFLANAPPAGRA
jgi:hypothetical protein